MPDLSPVLQLHGESYRELSGEIGQVYSVANCQCAVFDGELIGGVSLLFYSLFNADFLNNEQNFAY